MGAMNKQREKLLGKPSIVGNVCAVCGRPASNHHHVVQKGIGGSRYANQIPTLPLCGWGNCNGCHGAAHRYEIEFDYDEDRELWLWRRKGCETWRVCYGQERWKTIGARR